MVDEGDTSASASDIANSYDCAPDTLEQGPEVVYRFSTSHMGDFRAELSDAQGVDIDLHLLQDPEIDASGHVSGCLGRAHELLVIEDLPAGDYLLVADSWTSAGGTEYAGAYRLAFEVISPNVEVTVTVEPGVTWSRTRLEGASVQTLNVLKIASSSGWDLQPHRHAGCQTAREGMESVGAFAGVNANFYASCAPTDLLKEDGTLHSTNGTTDFEQRTVGWNGLDDLHFAWIQPDVDWPEVNNAVAGYPSLVNAGVPFAEVYQGEQVWSATDWQNNPRTLMGRDSQGRVVLATLDGRTPAGDGMTTPALAEWVTSELNLSDAVNLDGGGSTTMVVRDCWLNHTVSFPSDNEAADHKGLREVASGVYIR